MKGRITQWKDDKDFGFIVPDIGGEKIFFHITSVKNQARRPRIGDAVLYDTARDTQGRLKARGVIIEGITPRIGTNRNESVSPVVPANRDVLDYVSMLVAALSLVFGIYIFYETGNTEKAAPVGALFVAAIVILNRQKKPKEKCFTCARCKRIENHSKRTIRAWNNGFTKLYCDFCHKQWLREYGEPQANTGNGGCLGVAVILIILPVAAGYGVCNWLI